MLKERTIFFSQLLYQDNASYIIGRLVITVAVACFRGCSCSTTWLCASRWALLAFQIPIFTYGWLGNVHLWVQFCSVWYLCFLPATKIYHERFCIKAMKEWTGEKNLASPWLKKKKKKKIGFNHWSENHSNKSWNYLILVPYSRKMGS